MKTCVLCIGKDELYIGYRKCFVQSLFLIALMLRLCLKLRPWTEHWLPIRVPRRALMVTKCNLAKIPFDQTR